MVTLTPDEHRQWEAAVASWPTCPTCGGSGERWMERYDGEFGGRFPHPCTCVAGRVPQPVYIVIEGELPDDLATRTRQRMYEMGMPTGTGSDENPLRPVADPPGRIVPARWRVPVGEPCEIRAECPHWRSQRSCRICDMDGSVLLASAATVEVLPVVSEADTRYLDPPFVEVTDQGLCLLFTIRSDAKCTGIVNLDPLPVPGRHFVAVVTP
jgi:hypothetical protein